MRRLGLKIGGLVRCLALVRFTILSGRWAGSHYSAHIAKAANQAVTQSSSPLGQWLSALLVELNARKSHPPQEPADWRRASETGCNCADCQDLSRFLKDPNTKALRLPLAERRRQHLHQIIDGKRLDTTHVTERKGRPYVLVCTKTQASYERALKAYRLDLDQLEQISRLGRWLGKLQADSAHPQRKAKRATKRK